MFVIKTWPEIQPRQGPEIAHKEYKPITLK